MAGSFFFRCLNSLAASTIRVLGIQRPGLHQGVILCLQSRRIVCGLSRRSCRRLSFSAHFGSDSVGRSCCVRSLCSHLGSHRLQCGRRLRTLRSQLAPQCLLLLSKTRGQHFCVVVIGFRRRHLRVCLAQRSSMHPFRFPERRRVSGDHGVHLCPLLLDHCGRGLSLCLRSFQLLHAAGRLSLSVLPVCAGFQLLICECGLVR